eukprot:TRINITY_DN25448_c0_g1_i1.p1 TRINITY_DN25448_c0_g1~~TRINITY_DN25448_c0_g1_i1.p1  ORF type:complete len:577 (-),score=65.99 TRINITY_DN25448_c0_g1_i1:107-1837(-)
MSELQCVDLWNLKEGLGEKFLAELRSVPGPKALVFEPVIMSRIQAVVETSAVRACGVESFHLTSDNLRVPRSSAIIFVVRECALPNVGRQLRRFADPRNCIVYLVPRRSPLTEMILEEEGVLEQIELRCLDLPFIPLEPDVLSLDMPCDPTQYGPPGNSLFDVSVALVRVQREYGLFRNVYAVGERSCRVKRMLAGERRHISSPQEHFPVAIIIDREVDLLSVLMPQLTYEGLIDELWGITLGICRTPFPLQRALRPKPPPLAPVTPSPVDPTPNENTGRVVLNNADPLFAELRDRNFAVVGLQLHGKSVDLGNDYQRRHTMELPHLGAFTKRVGQTLTMERHVEIALQVNRAVDDDFRRRVALLHGLIANNEDLDVFEYVEECINKQLSFVSVLRLLAFVSAATGGLPSNRFDFFRAEVLKAYGFDKIGAWVRLERAGLLTRRGEQAGYLRLRKELKLWVPDVDEQLENDISYVFSGLAPLSVRLVELLLKNAWPQKLATLLPKHQLDEPSLSAEEPAPEGLFVFFVGGVTFAEIAALRLLRRKQCPAGQNFPFLIGSDRIINGSTYIRSIIEKQ